MRVSVAIAIASMIGSSSGKGLSTIGASIVAIASMIGSELGSMLLSPPIAGETFLRLRSPPMLRSFVGQLSNLFANFG